MKGVGDTPNQHDILTGSQLDGRAYTDDADHTCNNWTSEGEGSAQELCPGAATGSTGRLASTGWLPLAGSSGGEPIRSRDEGSSVANDARA